MRRHFAWLLLMVFTLSCTPYETVGSGTYLGFTVGVANAPPPPRVVFVERPAYAIVPGTSVYVIENSGYDIFQYGDYYYLSSGGYWYRARSYGGPFLVVDARRVPRAVLTVPSERWKRHPYLQRGERDRDRDEDRD